MRVCLFSSPSLLLLALGHCIFKNFRPYVWSLTLLCVSQQYSTWNAACCEILQAWSGCSSAPHVRKDETWNGFDTILLNWVTYLGAGCRLRGVEKSTLLVRMKWWRLKKRKREKSTGLGRITVEFLKKGGEIIVKWLRRLFNVYLNNGKVPEDCRISCTGKRKRSEWLSYRSISLLRFPRKVWQNHNRESGDLHWESVGWWTMCNPKR